MKGAIGTLEGHGRRCLGPPLRCRPESGLDGVQPRAGVHQRGDVAARQKEGGRREFRIAAAAAEGHAQRGAGAPNPVSKGVVMREPHAAFEFVLHDRASFDAVEGEERARLQARVLAFGTCDTQSWVSSTASRHQR